ncbi:MAG: hypothetical protein PWP76_103 [Candidatus Diapherotrites archaeon]|nr:hypothetical protein [Candidatus Diapherotrites archaeon]MDN5366797.1 hypothetical protein [Candidatus Diapherotrites archaeon]
MIADVIERVVFDDGYWDEALLFARYEVQRHVDAGYELKRYVESYSPYGRERIYAELEKDGERIIIFASPEDGLAIARYPELAVAIAVTTRKQ